MVSSVNSIQNNVNYPVDPLLIIQQYEQLYDQLINAKSPFEQKCAALKLWTFLMKQGPDGKWEENSSVWNQLEQAGAAVDYQPHSGESMEEDLNGVKNSLNAYLLNDKESSLTAVFEFSGDVAAWMGIGITPQSLFGNFENAYQAYLNAKDPNTRAFYANILKWFLSVPGYQKAMHEVLYEKDQGAYSHFAQNLKRVESLLQGNADPSSIETAMNQLLGFSS